MKNNRYYLIIIIVLLVSISVNILLFTETKRYENEFKNMLLNNSSILISSILENTTLLKKNINTETTSKNFSNITTNVDKIISLGVSIKKFNNNLDGYYIKTENLKFFHTINRLLKENSENSEHEINLTSLELNEFKKMSTFMRSYSQSIEQKVKGVTEDGMSSDYWETYRKKDYEFWEDIIKDLEKKSEELIYNI